MNTAVVPASPTLKSSFMLGSATTPLHMIGDDEAGVPHAPRVARRADSTFLARERNEEVAPAAPAFRVHEASRGDPAVEVGA
jgi:hypothetical protein